jgi:hypothetical protein
MDDRLMDEVVKTANMNVRKRHVSKVIELHIKIAMRSYFNNTSFWEGHRTQNLSFVAGGNAK